jgi:hypothetical protein
LVEKLKREMRSAGSAASSRFSALKAKVSADAEAPISRVEPRKKELDAEQAENRARLGLNVIASSP